MTRDGGARPAAQRPPPERLRRLRLRPEWAFLAVGATVGGLFVALLPFGTADEPAHLARAYQVSEGVALSERRDSAVGGLLPASLRRLRGPLRPDDRTFVDFRNTALYPPLAYLPHALAIAPGRAVELPPLALLYAGRLAGLATSLALVFLAIRITPIAKRVFLLLALTPMAIRQTSLLSADSVTNAAALLFLALLLRLSLAPVAGASVAPVVVSGLVACLSKLAYLPLSLLYLLCPVRRLGRRRHAAGFLLLTGGSALGFAAWLWAVRDLQLPQRIAPDADPWRQLAHIAGDPLGFARVLLADLQRNWAGQLHRVAYPGQAPGALGALHLAVAAGVALVDGRRDAALDLRAKALIAAVFAATYGLIQMMNYLAWNPVGAATVQFVQPRYYIPIAPLPFLLLSNRRFAARISDRRLTLLAAGFAAFTSLVALRYLLPPAPS